MSRIAGVRLATAAAGIRYKNRDDVVLFELAQGGTCAAVFTRNAFCAAPVIVAREHLAKGPVRYLLINSGNANAGTGVPGLRAARETCRLLAGMAYLTPCGARPPNGSCAKPDCRSSQRRSDGRTNGAARLR